MARIAPGGFCYHVLNRGNAQARVFHDNADYRGFLGLMAKAGEKVPMHHLAYCLMPNHFHLVVRPEADGDLGRWMQWLMTTHVRRHHRRHGTSGHLWQGRFKSFVIQDDAHLLTVLRYVERNPVRARLVERAQDWSWSSAGCGPGSSPVPITPGPVPRPADWLDWLNEPDPPDELVALRRNIARGTPWGETTWAERIAARLGLQLEPRPRGRPRKEPRQQ